MIDAIYSPILGGYDGAYKVSDLDALPFADVLELYEAAIYQGVLRWIASEPKEYTKQETR